MKKCKLVHDGCGYHITKKGYARFNCGGPRKGEYVHRYEAAKKLGRPLKKDEEVHHENTRKLDNSHGNLVIHGNREHGWVSAKQAFWMRILDIQGEKDFYAAIEQIEREGIKTGLMAQKRVLTVSPYYAIIGIGSALPALANRNLWAGVPAHPGQLLQESM